MLYHLQKGFLAETTYVWIYFTAEADFDFSFGLGRRLWQAMIKFLI
jgi:hypothetical protein